MKAIISYFDIGSKDTGSGGALFVVAFDEDWIQHHSNFELLCNAYIVPDEYMHEFIRLTLRDGALAVYEDSTRSFSLSYSRPVLAFNARYDSPMHREENNKTLAPPKLSGARTRGKDSRTVIKHLIKRIELLAPISSPIHRDSDAKYQIFVQAVGLKRCLRRCGVPERL